MKRRVLITKAPLPKAQQGLFTKEKLTNNAFQFPVTFKEGMEPGFEVKKNLGPVHRDDANIEAEKGETIITPMGDDAWTKTLPKTYVIGGKKHSKGGTPLDVPEGSFIFSDHLKERNQKIHEMLGKAAKKSGYTYAELSKPYMLNDDIRTLLDPDSDKITRETAEMNIKNKTDKLGMIALLQEASKGFSDDDGNVDIPSVALPYIKKAGIDIDAAIQPFMDAVKQPVQQQGMPGMDMGMPMPEQGMPEQGMPEQMPQMQRRGGLVKMKKGGGIPSYDGGGTSKLKPGERVRLNPTSGKYEIVNTQGIVVGYVNFPSDQSTKLTRSKVPSNSVILSRKEYTADPEAAYAAAGNKPLVIKNDDGTYKMVKAESALPQYAGEDLGTVFAGNTEIASKYGYLAERFNDPEVKQELARRAIAAIGEASGKSLSSAEKEKLKKKLEDSDFAYQLFMDMQKRNLGTYANQVAGKIKPIKEHKDAADPGSVSNADFMQSWAAIGLQAPSDEEAKLQQALYRGYASMIENKSSLPPSLQQKLKPFEIGQVGAADAADTKGLGFGKGKISIVDGKYTNTTTGQIASIGAPLKYTEGDLGLEDELMTPNTQTGPEYATQNIQKGWTAPNIYELYRTMGEIYNDVPQEPWMAAPATYIPRTYLLSPEDMQRNLRGMSMAQGEQLLASGMGPAAMAALTNLSGADQISQYTSQIHNANIQILNNAERDNANRLKEGAKEHTNVANTLHNYWAQLKDNVRARRSAAKAEFSKAFQAGEQTEMDLQGLQLMYPNFRLDPYSMDYKGFIPSGDIIPTAGSKTSITDRALDIQASRPNMTYAEALSYAKTEAGVNDNTDILNALSRLQVP